MLERIGPELRQYIVANNREELPFNRSQRSWVYASSKKTKHHRRHQIRTYTAVGHISTNPALLLFRMPEAHQNREMGRFDLCAKVMGATTKERDPTDLSPSSIFRPWLSSSSMLMPFRL